MEGLGNSSRATFINIIGGKFAVRVKEGTEGAVQRINKNGDAVYELQYDHFTGYIKDLYVVNTEKVGKQYNIKLTTSNGDEYVWTTPYSNPYTKAFLKMLPNVDFTKVVKITPSSKEVEGKRNNTLFMSQDNNIVKHAYTKDTPGYPELEQLMVKGQLTWDDTKQMQFLENVVETQVLPKLNVTPKQAPATIEEAHDMLTEDQAF